MASKWITVNENLRNGISLINQLSQPEFEALMGLIASAVGNSDILASKDISKFKESSNLGETNWNLLIQSLVHIFKLSLKFIFKPTALQKQLEEDLKLDHEKAKEFVKQWSMCTKRDFGDLENRYKMNDVTWQLNVQVASSTHSKEATHNARLQLNVSKPKSDIKENVTLELNCEELVQLYNSLENMQSKLDSITN